jgi:hypothetical protein
MSRRRHTVTAPTGVFRSRVSSPYSVTETGQETYVSYRNQIKPWTVVYTLNGGHTWAVNSWHARRDLAERERRRLGYDGGNAQAVVIQANY